MHTMAWIQHMPTPPPCMEHENAITCTILYPYKILWHFSVKQISFNLHTLSLNFEDESLEEKEFFTSMINIMSSMKISEQN